MTNRKLLSRSNALQEAAEAVQTTRLRYAVQANLKRVTSLLEPYHETLTELAEEHNVDVSGGLPDDEDFRREVGELLAQDAGTMDVHSVPPSVLDREDEKDTDLPIEVLADLDFMIGTNESG